MFKLPLLKLEITEKFDNFKLRLKIYISPIKNEILDIFKIC